VLAALFSGLTDSEEDSSRCSQPVKAGSFTVCVRDPEKFPGSFHESTRNVAVGDSPHDVGIVNSGSSGASDEHSPSETSGASCTPAPGVHVRPAFQFVFAFFEPDTGRVERARFFANDSQAFAAERIVRGARRVTQIVTLLAYTSSAGLISLPAVVSP